MNEDIDFTADTTDFDNDLAPFHRPNPDFLQKAISRETTRNGTCRYIQDRTYRGRSRTRCLLHSPDNPDNPNNPNSSDPKKRYRHHGPITRCTCPRIPSDPPRPLIPFNSDPFGPFAGPPVLQSDWSRPHPIMGETEFDQPSPVLPVTNFETDVTDLLIFWQTSYRLPMNDDSRKERLTFSSAYMHYETECIGALSAEDFERISSQLGIRHKLFVKKKFTDSAATRSVLRFNWERLWKKGVMIKVLIERFWTYYPNMDIGEAYSHYCSQICHPMHKKQKITENDFVKITKELGLPRDTKEESEPSSDLSGLKNTAASDVNSKAVADKESPTEESEESKRVENSQKDFVDDCEVSECCIESDEEWNQLISPDEVSIHSCPDGKQEQVETCNTSEQPVLSFSELMSKFEYLENSL